MAEVGDVELELAGNFLGAVSLIERYAAGDEQRTSASVRMESIS